MESDEAALQTLALAWAQLPAPGPDAPILFLRAQVHAAWPPASHPGWRLVQPSKPLFDALRRRAWSAQPEYPTGTRFARSVLLAPRQRAWARALLAQAVQATEIGGIVMAAAHNDEGARSLQADLAALCGTPQVLAKHHARACWTRPLDASSIDRAILGQWLALDEPVVNEAGWTSRPGLFAWDRIDPGSALLADLLPADLHGDVADLGAGWGYLACRALARCPGIRHLDLYEADWRAQEPARRNLARAAATVEVHWHDVLSGLPRRYDAIVCNPPFHRQRQGEPELGQGFIRVAAASLHAHGTLWIVANRHLPYESTLGAHFGQVTLLRESQGYKAFMAAGPRA